MMRGVLAYLVGVAAAISVGLVGLRALPTTIERTVPAPFAVLFHIRMPFNLKLWSAIADASHKAHLTEPHKQTVGQKVRPQQNDNTVRVARKRTLEAED